MVGYPRRGGPFARLVAPPPGLAPDDPRRRRHALAGWMYVAGSALLAFFIPFDLFVTGYTLHALAEAVALCAITVTWIFLRRTGNLDLTGWLGSGIAGATILFVIFSGEAADSVLAWAPLFPAVPFFLLGCRRGLALVALYGVALTGGLIWAVNDGTQGFNVVSAFNALGATAGAAAILHWYERTREVAARHLEDAANTDFLTGAVNRRHFQALFEVEASRARRHGRPLALLLVDLDHFKRINDTFGHEAGDAAIIHTARLLKDGVRRSDVVGRIGGEEFAVLLPDTTGAGACVAAEALRAAIADEPVAWREGRIGITASIGVAQLAPDDDFATAFAEADRRLYAAKAAGRDRVVGDDAPQAAPAALAG